jgi:hypothetical protein
MNEVIVNPTPEQREAFFTDAAPRIARVTQPTEGPIAIECAAVDDTASCTKCYRLVSRFEASQRHVHTDRCICGGELIDHDLIPPPAAQREAPAAPTAKRPAITNGTRLVATDGTAYVVSNVRSYSLTLRRELPKVRGKAARKADKRARRAA